MEVDNNNYPPFLDDLDAGFWNGVGYFAHRNLIIIDKYSHAKSLYHLS